MSQRRLRMLCLLTATILSGIWVGCEENGGFVPSNQNKYSVRLFNLHPGLDGASFRFYTDEGFEYTIDKMDFEETWPQSGYADLLARGISSDVGDSTDVMYLEAINPITRAVLMDPVELEFIKRDQLYSVTVIDDQGQAYVAQLPDGFETPMANHSGAYFTTLNYSYDRVSYQMAQDTTLIGNNYLYRTNYVFPSGRKTVYVINELSGNIIDSLSVGFRPGKMYEVYFSQRNSSPILGSKVLEE